MYKTAIVDLVLDMLDSFNARSIEKRLLMIGMAIAAIYEGNYHVDYEITEPVHVMWVLNRVLRNNEAKAINVYDQSIVKDEARFREGLHTLLAAMYEQGLLPKLPKRLTALPPVAAED
jgi:hypothetical protein